MFCDINLSYCTLMSLPSTSACLIIFKLRIHRMSFNLMTTTYLALFIPLGKLLVDSYQTVHVSLTTGFWWLLLAGLGIELLTMRFVGDCFNHWATCCPVNLMFTVSVENWKIAALSLNIWLFSPPMISTHACGQPPTGLYFFTTPVVQANSFLSEWLCWCLTL